MSEVLITDPMAMLVIAALGGVAWAIRFMAVSRTRDAERKINSDNRVVDALSDLSSRVSHLEGSRGLPALPVGKRAVTRAGFERTSPATDSPPLVMGDQDLDDTDPGRKRR